MTYAQFFAAATGNAPFPFQLRFRESIDRSVVLRVPTGLGKTEAILVAWLHARPTKRLCWCLPGRTLTEQVAKKAEELVKALVKAALLPERLRVCRLMGGHSDSDLKLAPDESAILVGTQDILLSRALNRGYARNPFRWPMDFALLNNDCYWVLDEVQLLGDGLATSLQLAAFRECFGTFGNALACWSSATIAPDWLKTVDFMGARVPVVSPDAEDRANGTVARRLSAEKRLMRAPETCRAPAGVADFVAAEHARGTLALVVANTVRRAVEIWKEVRKRDVAAEVRLLHSRFRPEDREAVVNAVLGKVPIEGRIIVATQVIEAGMDLDATLMVTDVAPYASMVQRFGRVNRRGDRSGCRISWVDQPAAGKKPKDGDKTWLPYDAEEVRQAIERLEHMTSAAPEDLDFSSGARPPWKHVLRRADVLDLFDTSSDLGGNEIDVSRFVRSDEDRDVYVLWREWENPDSAPPVAPEIDDAELCPAPIGDVNRKEILESAWAWNSIAGRWERPQRAYPGVRLVFHASAGRYTVESGWSPESKAPVTPVMVADAAEMEKADQDPRSKRYRQSLDEHTQWVCQALVELLQRLRGLDLSEYVADLKTAAQLHDWGKSHDVMQRTLHGTEGPYSELLAKSDTLRPHKPPHFRHELASALAMLETGETDLAAYLAAAHHGRVRVVIRSMPTERADGTVRIRGIREHDLLPPCTVAGRAMPQVSLSLKWAELGRGDYDRLSWTDRVVGLRERLGPFRLAYLEMLVRTADGIASARPNEA